MLGKKIVSTFSSNLYRSIFLSFQNTMIVKRFYLLRWLTWKPRYGPLMSHGPPVEKHWYRPLDQRSVLSPLLFAVVVDVISKNARELELMNEILHADDLVFMSESIDNLKEKFLKWKKTFESKRLKVNIKKTKVIVNDLKGDVLQSKVLTHVLKALRG